MITPVNSFKNEVFYFYAIYIHPVVSWLELLALAGFQSPFLAAIWWSSQPHDHFLFHSELKNESDTFTSEKKTRNSKPGIPLVAEGSIIWLYSLSASSWNIRWLWVNPVSLMGMPSRTSGPCVFSTCLQFYFTIQYVLVCRFHQELNYLV